MRTAIRLVGATMVLVGLPLLGGLTGQLTPRLVHAATTWSVQAGGDTPDGFGPDAFFPSTLTIHVGDTVNWTVAGFHTVTFDPHQTLPPDMVSGPNPGEITFQGAYLPTGPQGPDAIFDGTQPVSSGTPQGRPDPQAPPYALTFTEPGAYTYFCVVHPGMTGTVTVLAAPATLPETPDQAQARGHATLQQILAEGQSGAGQVTATRVNPQLAGGVYAVTAGVSIGSDAGAAVSALQFLPSQLTVHSGDAVVWTNADQYELHTITFTSGEPLPNFPEIRPQPNGPPLVVASAKVAGPVGGTSYGGQGYLNSGLLTTGQSVAFTITAPPGTYQYVCIIHKGTMQGTITVLP
jgi:plastocyanin